MNMTKSEVYQRHRDCTNHSFRSGKDLKEYFSDDIFESFVPDTNTPFLALDENTETVVFSVNDEGILQGNKVIASRREVEDVEAVELPIGQFRRLAGCRTSAGQTVVFFENSTGQLQCIVDQDPGWKLLDPFMVQRVEGTPCVAMSTSDWTVAVLYCHKDNHLHRLTLNLRDNTHADTVQPGTEFKRPPADFTVDQSENDDRFSIGFILKKDAGQTLLQVSPDGVRLEIKGDASFYMTTTGVKPIGYKTQMVGIHGGQGN